MAPYCKQICKQKYGTHRCLKGTEGIKVGGLVDIGNVSEAGVRVWSFHKHCPFLQARLIITSEGWCLRPYLNISLVMIWMCEGNISMYKNKRRKEEWEKGGRASLLRTSNLKFSCYWRLFRISSGTLSSFRLPDAVSEGVSSVVTTHNFSYSVPSTPGSQQVL